MSILATLLGGGGSSVVTAAGSVLDELVTSDEEEGRIEVEKLRLRLMPVLAAWEERKAQAQHGSIFVAGARPALMWVAAAGVAYCWLLQPLLAVILGPEAAPALPEAHQENLLWLTVTLYGLRGAEGMAGAKRSRIVRAPS
ncbi:MAG: 3TM-type holin [Pseudomonadota bacterium]